MSGDYHLYGAGGRGDYVDAGGELVASFSGGYNVALYVDHLKGCVSYIYTALPHSERLALLRLRLH